jgi:hypothetical protein
MLIVLTSNDKNSPPGLSARPYDGLRMVDGAVGPRGNWGCKDQLACIDRIKHTPKHALKASVNSLRGRIRGLLLKDVKVGYMGCRCERALGMGLWGVGGGYG